MKFRRSAERVIGSKLVDSSVWIAHISKGSFEEVFSGDEQLFLSVISLFEIWKKLIKDKVSSSDIEKTISALRDESIILPVNEGVAEKAVKMATEKGLPMADALIYATAVVHELDLVTCDNDFRGLKGVELLEMGR